MSYKVFIPTAGIGSRLNSLTRNLNKSLVSVNNKPIISHIINYFPIDAEFVIALGYEGDVVKEFLENLYPQRKIDFVFIDPYFGEKSGLGYTMLSCKHLLQEPFVFISCDTLVINDIPSPNHDWIAYSNKSDISSYRTVEIKSNKVNNFKEKGQGLKDNDFPYIGLSGINNYHNFWEGMNNAKINNLDFGEVSGLISLIQNGLKCYEMNWFDTGNLESLNIAKEQFASTNSPVILVKQGEAIWFLENKVVKFSKDTNFIKNRVKRAIEIKDFVPNIIKSSKHMYVYEKEEGDVMSKKSDLPLFMRLLDDSKVFWQKKNLSKDLKKEFKKQCLSFYKDKTKKRVEKFFEDFEIKDEISIINGERIQTLENLFGLLDWEYISNGLPVRFHGDFHFENIIWNFKKNKFIFLDWRQDFGGSLSHGDLYYDLAKLMHGLIVSHQIINDEQFKVELNSNKFNFELKRFQRDVEFEVYFNEWILKNNYDLKKVKILCSLIYLNIAPLHHEPYNYLLFALGKLMLHRQLH